MEVIGIKKANFTEDEVLETNFANLLKSYQKYDNNPKNIELIKKAYELAKKLHSGVVRKSGEAYLFHPLRVAIMAVKYKMDAVTICTCLLHDVEEDTIYTYEDIKKEFSKIIADNVECVTKMTKEKNYGSSQLDLHVKTVCKLFRHLDEVDIRGPVAKILDRTDNMRTLEFMKKEKQIIKSEETMNIYAPLAQGCGANALKKELHDLAFKYLNPDKYNQIKEELQKIMEKYQQEIIEIEHNLHQSLLKDGIKNSLKLRLKNIYSVYISLEKGRNYDSIHDLFAFQINVPEIKDCFEALNIIHENYNFLDEKFKDYIHSPKTTGYRALHSTLISPHDRMYQAQIRTNEMGIRNSYGLLYNLKIDNLEKDTRHIKEYYPFFRTLEDIDRQYPEDDLSFYDKIKSELLGDKIYVRSASGKVYSLPVGATIVDYAYLVCSNRAPFIVKGKINGQMVDIATPLKNQDLVDFISSPTQEFDDEVLAMAKTTKAKMLILEKMKENEKRRK